GERGGAHYSEAAVRLLEAIENDRGTIQVVNVPNRGAVPFLQPEDVAETRCRVTKDGPLPVPLKKDPGAHIKGLMQAVKAYEKLAARAALTGCYTDAVSALLTNPLTQDYPGAKSALDEMLAANREYLPQFSPYFEGVSGQP
ncbi:MAG: 6-phospho-beta-glucosidase, partial [Oscillospiraceae bacterium]|nr:6-phospho-beta-glucosidase [Oscillospiraceae bacterium]